MPRMAISKEQQFSAHIRARPHLREIFQFYQKIEEIWHASAPDDLLPTVDLRDQNVRDRRRVGRALIDRQSFDRISFSNSEVQFRKIMTVMRQGGGEKEVLSQRLASFLRVSGRSESWLIKTVLTRDDAYLDRVSLEMEVPGPLLMHLIKMTLRISFERLHETLRTILNDLDWDFPLCPICGGAPSIGQSLSEGKRRYFCFFCSFSWVSTPPSGCPACGLIDSNRVNLLYKHPEENQAILACEGCQSYIKIVDQRSEKEVLNPDFQEILGIHLDIAAGEMGFHPLGQSPNRSELIIRPGSSDPRP